jgi:hypothetical protein
MPILPRKKIQARTFSCTMSIQWMWDIAKHFGMWLSVLSAALACHTHNCQIFHHGKSGLQHVSAALFLPSFPAKCINAGTAQQSQDRSRDALWVHCLGTHGRRTLGTNKGKVHSGEKITKCYGEARSHSSNPFPQSSGIQSTWGTWDKSDTNGFSVTYKRFFCQQ